MGIINFGKHSDLTIIQDFVDTTKYNLEDLAAAPLRESLGGSVLELNNDVWKKDWVDYPNLVSYIAKEAGIDLSKSNDSK